MLLEIPFGSTILGIGSQCPGIHASELWEVVVKVAAKGGLAWPSCRWCREPICLAVSQQSVLHLVIFASLMGERWCLSVVYVLCFGFCFYCEKVENLRLYFPRTVDKRYLHLKRVQPSPLRLQHSFTIPDSWCH